MATALPYNEPKLLARIAQGDERAFTRIVDRYTDIIYPQLLSYIKDPSRAEEVTQDIFLRIWNNRERLTEMENFRGYLYVITRNRAMTALKEQLAYPAKDQLDLLDTKFAGEESLSLEVKELRETLERAVNTLPPRRKEVFLLSRNEDLTYNEIATRLGISRSAVRQHIVEALVYLRTYLKDSLGVTTSYAGLIMLLVGLLLEG